MAGIAIRNTRLSGVDYVAGQVVPSELVNRRTIALGLVSPIPDELAGSLAPAAADTAPGEATAPGGGDATGEFDPGAHTVAEVESYLAEYPEDTERVRAAETAGKARSTLLSRLDEQLAGDATGEFDPGTAGTE